MKVSTIGNLVANTPQYAAVFEKLGIDYCCKGNKTLKEACDEKQLNIDEVVEKLSKITASGAAVKWDELSAKQIVEHIVDTYHTHLRQELPRISQLLKKVSIKHGQRYPYIISLQVVFEEMKDYLLKHLDDEEQHVFPLFDDEKSNQQEIQKQLALLVDEHEETGLALEKIKMLTNGYTPPADACMTHIVLLDSLKHLEQNVHEHIHKENHILFARCRGM